MEAILALRKIVTPSGPKDKVHPRMCRCDCNQKPKDFYKLWALESLERIADEALREYFVDLDVPLSEGNEYMPIRHMEDRSDWGLGARQKMRSLKEKRAYGGTKRMCTAAALVDELMDKGDDHGQGSEQLLDHGPTTPEPPTGPSQMQSANDPSFTEATTGPQAPIGPAQPQTANEPAFTEAMTGPKAPIGPTPPGSGLIGFWSLEGQDICIIGGPSNGAGLKHDDADVGQHHEPGVDIDDDVLGADGEHVTHVHDIVEEVVAVDVTFQSTDAEGEHLPPVDAFVDAAAGAIVPYRESTPDAVEIRSSSLESSAVHHGAAEISDPIERAQLKMASKYMASLFVDPLVTRLDVRDKIIEDYEAFKKKESARRNVGILGDQGADFS
ncbi:PREDICTED: uncharacterized protein LOC108661986 [Theobroma cacao]|uniref:Uncharacterized protein LOC108661986 n=1 Tax=Theobroma cacao TaxID=3641 RepID=A0AB32WAI0_THECC|nr:PREDICTED: uncharacterized protein LOC108661986 [Theobroma cacao]